MFEKKKTLIVVYKDELLVNQLKKMVETRDDSEEETVGTKDDSISIVSWTEKVWMENKKAGNIQGKILFLGDIKGTDKLIPVLDIKFDKCGVKYGWAGNQAALFVDSKTLKNREVYDDFLKELSALPVPDFLKTMKENVITTGTDPELEAGQDLDLVEVEEPQQKPHALKVAQKVLSSGAEAVSKVGEHVAAKSEELFRNKSLMRRQMLFYGVIHLYRDGLESFMNL